MRLGLGLALCGVVAGSAVCHGQMVMQGRPQRDVEVKEKAPETPEAKKLKEENERKAKELLQRAYANSKDLSESDRAAILARLASSSARVMPDQSKAWADEVFQITQGLNNDTFRGQYEMTAMMAGADNDPDHALQLLLQMSPPVLNQEGKPGLDLRSQAAAGVFQKYYQKKGEAGLPMLQSTARQLGEQGLYPFMAMGSIIRNLGKNDPDKAQALVTEALVYFPRLQQSDMSGQQVAMFLRMNQAMISKPVMKDVLTQMVNKVMATKETDNSMTTTISTNGNTATLKGASTLMMFQLMPLINDVDPEWAKKLENENEQLRNAVIAQQNSPSGTNTVRMGVFMSGGGPPRGNPIDPMKAMEVDELAQKDPMGAIKMSDEISDPVLRTATSVAIAGEINNTDPAQAARLVKNAKDAIAATPEQADKLRILTGLAQAQSSMKDKDGLNSTMDQAFAMGEDLYRKSIDKNPDAGVNTRPGIDSLTRLAGIGIKADQSSTLAHIDRVNAAPLQTMLLISAAENLDPDIKPAGGGFRIMIRN
jgi:hypothetical protein